MKRAAVTAGVLGLLIASALAGERDKAARPLTTLKQKASYGAGLRVVDQFPGRRLEAEYVARGVADSAAGRREDMLEMEKGQYDSYRLGLRAGRGFKDQSLLDLDPEALAQGIRDRASGAPLRIGQPEAEQALRDYRGERLARLGKAPEAAAAGPGPAERNRSAGEAFLAANARRAGVKVLPSGLQYKVLRAGEGRSPAATDTVTVHYRGTLLDGTEFDSSHRRGEPLTVSVDGVIRGWTEALVLMKVGDKWQLAIPPNLAYGPKGTPDGRIGPDATLLFELELLDIR